MDATRTNPNPDPFVKPRLPEIPRVDAQYLPDKPQGATALTTTTKFAIAAVVIAVVGAAVIAVAVVLTRQSLGTDCVVSGTDACTNSLEEHLQNIATGCEVDTGRCVADACTGCDMCCGPVFETRNETCSGVNVIYSKVVGCSCVSCGSFNIAVSGRVTGACTSTSSCELSIQRNGQEVTTSNTDGYYTFVTSYPTNNKVSYTVVDVGGSYLNSIQDVTVSRDTQSYVSSDAVVQERVIDARFSASDGTSVSISDDASVVIAPGSIKTASGETFVGDVEVSMSTINTASQDSLDRVSLSLTTGNTEDGTGTVMMSEGMIIPVVTSATTGEALEVNGVVIDLADLNPDVTDTLPVVALYYDEEVGDWIETSQLRDRGRRSFRNANRTLSVTIDISSAQRIYNLDRLVRSYCYMKARVFKNERDTDQIYGASVTSLYKVGGKWSNYLKRRAYSRGICVQVPCNQNQWPIEQVLVQATGHTVYAPNVPDDILTGMNYTVYNGNDAFEISLPPKGTDIPISSEGPFYRYWSDCYYADMTQNQYFRFVKSFVGNASDAATTAPTPTTNPSGILNGSLQHFVCSSVSLDASLFQYLDYTAEFNVSLYTLSGTGVVYNGTPIPFQSMTFSAIYALSIGIYSYMDGSTHQLGNVGPQLSYRNFSSAVDPFFGAVTVYPVGPQNISARLDMYGNFSVDGGQYQHFGVSSLYQISSYPGGLPHAGTFTWIPGVTVGECFSYNSTNTPSVPTAMPGVTASPGATVFPNPGATVFPTPGATVFPTSSTSTNNFTFPSFTSLASHFLCSSASLDAAVFQWVNVTAPLDISLYGVTSTGILYRGSPVANPGISLDGLYYFDMGIYSFLDRWVHRLNSVGGQLNYYNGFSNFTDPFIGSLVVYPNGPFNISARLEILGNISINGMLYQRFGLSSSYDASFFPGSVAHTGAVTIFPGVTVDGCFSFTNNNSFDALYNLTYPGSLFNGSISAISTMHCQDLSLGVTIFQYFGNPFDSSAYSLTGTGIVYNGTLIPFTDITIASVPLAFLQAHSDFDGILHQLHSNGSNIAYTNINITGFANFPVMGASSPFPYAGDPYNVTVYIAIHGSVIISGNVYQSLVVGNSTSNYVNLNLVSDVPFANPITIVPGVTANSCSVRTYGVSGTPPTQTVTP